MENNENESKPVKRRLDSIDALRAAALFGILLVHAASAFGWSSMEYTSIGEYTRKLIKLFLSGRCRIVFRLLYGVGLYWILRHHEYPSSKYVWRCFLLCLIGLFNKLFFTHDVLLWYGLWGMVLVCFRNLSVKQLWLSFVAAFILNTLIVEFVDLRELIFDNDFVYDRYGDGKNLSDALRYPLWQTIYHKMTIRAKVPFDTFSMFLLGYYLAESGIIDNLRKYVTVKYFLIFTIPYVVIEYLGLHFHIAALNTIGDICGSFSYSLLFLLIYYKTYPLLRFLESYGRMSLTNYSMQGIVGVVLAGHFFLPHHWLLKYFILAMVLFYAIQVAFSMVWMKYYKYGPFEWLWRCGTERKWIKNKQTRIIQ